MNKYILIVFLCAMPFSLHSKPLKDGGSIWELTKKNVVLGSENVVYVKDSIKSMLCHDSFCHNLLNIIPDTVYTTVCTHFIKEKDRNALHYKLFFYRIKAMHFKSHVLRGRRHFDVKELLLINSLMRTKFPVSDKYGFLVYSLYSKRIYPFYNEYGERMVIVYCYIKKETTPYEFFDYPYSLPAIINIDKKCIEDFDW